MKREAPSIQQCQYLALNFHLDPRVVQQLLPFCYIQICLLKCVVVPNDFPQWRPNIIQCNPVRFPLIFHAEAESSKRCRPKAAELSFRVMQACSATLIVSNCVFPIFWVVHECLLQGRKEQRSKFNWLTNVTFFLFVFVLLMPLFIQSGV